MREIQFMWGKCERAVFIKKYKLYKFDNKKYTHRHDDSRL